MIIRNKFNGYGFDGARLYNDPVTLSVAATEAAAASSAAAAAATTAATVAAPTVAATTLPTVVAGSTLPTTAAFTGQAVTPALTSAGTGLGAGTTAGGIGAGAGTGAGAGAGAGTGGIFSGAPAGTTTLGGASSGITGPSTGMIESSLNAIDPSIAQFAEAQNIAAQNLAAQGSNIQGGAAQRAFETAANPPVDPGISSGNTMQYAENAPIRGVEGNLESGGTFTDKLLNNPIVDKITTGADKIGEGFMKAMNFAEKHPIASAVAAHGIQSMLQEEPKKKQYAKRDLSGFQRSEPSTGIYNPVYQTSSNYAVGGPVERMAAMNAVGANTGYPQANLQTPLYSNPAIQRPQSTNVVAPSADAGVDSYTGEPRFAEGGSTSSKYLKMLEAEEKKRREEAEEAMYQARKVDVGIAPRSRTQQLNSPYAAAMQELQALSKKRGIPFAKPAKTSVDVMGETDEVPYAAGGGIMSHLGGYSDGGRLLKGPGDGMSDSIPAKIGAKQPARLADGEFVIPADVVSHLGNGSTEAGAKKLYAMMDKVRHARTGNKKQGKQINPDKFIPKA